MKNAMGRIECYVCPITWEEIDSPDGKDFCSVKCFEKMYKGKNILPEDLYHAKLERIKTRIKKNGIKF